MPQVATISSGLEKKNAGSYGAKKEIQIKAMRWQCLYIEDGKKLYYGPVFASFFAFLELELWN